MLTLSADQQVRSFIIETLQFIMFGQNLLRKQNLIHLDKQETCRKEIDKSNLDYNELLKKLADAEARLSEADM